ncbi:MAG: hypothetical protein KIT68_12515 [Phycisphaeraceae bacterium]|nr:hypothetical protein [Phycisphaeraceae bacterium]
MKRQTRMPRGPAGVVALCVLLAGCAGQEPAPREEPPAISAATASPVRGGQNGVEIRFWPVMDESIAEGELARLEAAAPPVDPDVRAMWAAAGLRLIAVPLSQVERLGAVLAMAPAARAQGVRPVLSVTRLWVPQGPLWTEAVRGPQGQGARTIALHDSRLSIGPEPVRLLVRCWTVPVLPADGVPDGPPAAAVHLEVAPQVLDAPGRVSSDLRLLEPGRRSELDRGLVLTRLSWSAELPPDMAILIACEPLRVDAPAAASAEGAAAPPSDGAGVVKRRESLSEQPPAPPAGSRGPATAAGPPSDPVPTLGRALLTYTGPNGRPQRGVVLLVPHAPERFTLGR